MSYQTTPPVRAASSAAWNRISEQEKSVWTNGVPKIVVAGLKRAGKSSILRVLFNKLSPHEASYIETTSHPSFLPLSGNPLLNVHIAEIPGNWSWEESEQMDQLFFSQCQSLILVIDASSEDLPSAVFSLAKRVVARAARATGGKLGIHLFLHKVDANYRFDPDSSHAESNKASFVQNVVNRVSEDAKNIFASIPAVAAHCTSIFDHSLHEAFAQVLQQPLLANGRIEQMMDLILTTCRLEKAVLFDTVSKISLASDSGRQVDPSTIALMQDMLDVVIDMSGIYGPGHDCAAPTSCEIRLSNKEVLFMKIVGKNLALVSILKSENLDKTFLLNHNLAAFSQAILQVAAIM